MLSTLDHQLSRRGDKGKSDLRFAEVLCVSSITVEADRGVPYFQQENLEPQNLLSLLFQKFATLIVEDF